MTSIPRSTDAQSASLLLCLAQSATASRQRPAQLGSLSVVSVLVLMPQLASAQSDVCLAQQQVNRPFSSATRAAGTSSNLPKIGTVVDRVTMNVADTTAGDQGGTPTINKRVSDLIALDVEVDRATWLASTTEVQAGCSSSSVRHSIIRGNRSC
jgi:hypothetical protein